MLAFLIILATYLIGSIPFGLVGKFFFKIQDPRTFGSKILAQLIFSGVATKRQRLLHFSLICLKGSLQF